MTEQSLPACLHIYTKQQAIERGLRHYFTGKPCKRGHFCVRYVASGCAECNRIRAGEFYLANLERCRAYKRAKHAADPEPKREAARKRRTEKAGAVKEAGRRYYQENAEKIKARTRSWAAANRAAKNAYNKKWNSENKESALAHQRAYEKKRLKSDPVYALRCRMQTAIRNSLIKGGYTKRSRTQEYLGCTYEQLKQHLERQFLKGMTWENRSLWHIDHIVPLASAETEDDMVALQKFTNLRPLWAKDNLEKSDHLTHLI